MNELLSHLVKQWQLEGSKPQESFDWSRSTALWLQAFPDYAGFISGIPSSLDREHVRQICKDPNNLVLEKFLSVMIWGYGDRGYGPYRVSKMLSVPHAEEVLSQVYELCRNSRPKEAYQHLMQNRIQVLGPSFGTKFMTFCTPRRFGAPILDSLVGEWIKENASQEFDGVTLNYETWNLKMYSKYWDWIKEHAEYFSCNPDDVELVIFRHASTIKAPNSKGTLK